MVVIVSSHRNSYDVPDERIPDPPGVHTIRCTTALGNTSFDNRYRTGTFARSPLKDQVKKRSEQEMYVLVCRDDHVIAENFVNKRIGNKNINNDRCDRKNKKKEKISENLVQIDFEWSQSSAEVSG
jgi:CRISPR/Cas system-associated endonuclease Cas1